VREAAYWCRTEELVRATHHQQQGRTISNSGKRPDRGLEDASEAVLRAKYLDWCSAQVADELFALTPDEIFELAERAAKADPEVAGRSFFAPVADAEEMSSYRRLVEAVTEVLTQQMDLPTYDRWLELYRENPAAVEGRLLGLWRERT
jgi:hypothetical protein